VKYTKPPKWIKRAMPGVCYWIAHRRSLYRNHPLPEAALVAELCNLIHANIDAKYILKCEVMFKKLINNPETKCGKQKVDLVIYNNKNVPKYIIEVKRASASKAKINEDLKRLALLKSENPNARAFLVLISEKSRPKEFVHENGKSIRTKNELSENESYSVIFTWKSLFGISQNSIDKGNYSCLIEVLRKG
jgi:hypothetical protein